MPPNEPPERIAPFSASGGAFPGGPGTGPLWMPNSGGDDVFSRPGAPAGDLFRSGHADHADHADQADQADQVDMFGRPSTGSAGEQALSVPAPEMPIPPMPIAERPRALESFTANGPVPDNDGPSAGQPRRAAGPPVPPADERPRWEPRSAPPVGRSETPPPGLVRPDLDREPYRPISPQQPAPSPYLGQPAAPPPAYPPPPVQYPQQPAPSYPPAVSPDQTAQYPVSGRSRPPAPGPSLPTPQPPPPASLLPPVPSFAQPTSEPGPPPPPPPPPIRATTPEPPLAVPPIATAPPTPTSLRSPAPAAAPIGVPPIGMPLVGGPGLPNVPTRNATGDPARSRGDGARRGRRDIVKPAAPAPWQGEEDNNRSGRAVIDPAGGEPQLETPPRGRRLGGIVARSASSPVSGAMKLPAAPALPDTSGGSEFVPFPTPEGGSVPDSRPNQAARVGSRGLADPDPDPQNRDPLLWDPENPDGLNLEARPTGGRSGGRNPGARKKEPRNQGQRSGSPDWEPQYRQLPGREAPARSMTASPVGPLPPGATLPPARDAPTPIAGIAMADRLGHRGGAAEPMSGAQMAARIAEVAPAPAAGHGRAGRNLPAAIGVGVLLAGLALVSLFTRPEAFVALVSLVAVLAVWELAGAMAAKQIVVPVIPLAVGSLGMLVSAYLAGEEGLLVSFTLTGFGVLLWRIIDGMEGALRDVTAGLFTAAYVPLLAGFAILLLADTDGPQRVVTFIVVTVASDIGGYIAGVIAGKHPMAPTISPKKSWEGFAGSVLFCLIAGVACVVLLLDSRWWVGLVLGAAAAVCATLGDLSESLLKRDLGVKDMGSLLPGHGGIMDRLDSLLPNAPVAYLLLHFLVSSS